MKKFVQQNYIFLFICLSLLPSTLYADAKFDTCNHEKETLSSLICYGPAVLTGTTISGDMKISGSLTASDISVGAIDIVGDVEIKKSKVNGAAVVTGAVHANDVDFMQDITVKTSDMVLNHSRVHGSISIRAPGENDNAYLHAQCGTIIAGSVTFEGKPGTVEISGDSVVQGKVVNGAIEFVDRDCG